MPVKTTVLFGKPQSEIASRIRGKIAASSATSIVTGFATVDGISAIDKPILANPASLQTLVVGAGTYKAFEALDGLLGAGVPADRLYVHLGHTQQTGGRKNPFARYHPMLHSKVYYMEHLDGTASAFVGSHNTTFFALTGLNGEAAILLEGPVASPEFDDVRRHIETARRQAACYSSELKEAYAWWTRQFIDGLGVEIGIPQDWTSGRTILIFAQAAKTDRPATGDGIYFELPAGIQQIESLKTEVHLFLFEILPPTPWDAIRRAMLADARLKCMVRGAENKQGNLEVSADWHIDPQPKPVLKQVPTRVHRPNTAKDMQQVRAEVLSEDVEAYEYAFDAARTGWEPIFANEPPLHPMEPDHGVAHDQKTPHSTRTDAGWLRVEALQPRSGPGKEEDAAALRLASPESGSFMLVSLRKRKHDPTRHREEGT